MNPVALLVYLIVNWLASDKEMEAQAKRQRLKAEKDQGK